MEKPGQVHPEFLLGTLWWQQPLNLSIRDGSGGDRVHSPRTEPFLGSRCREAAEMSNLLQAGVGLSVVRSSGCFAGAEGCLYTDGASVG